jgi:hypothetical protein
MTDVAQRMWAEQDRHRGDRWRLFTAVRRAVSADRVLYPGSYVDLAPSFVFPSVTYIDTDDRAASFFGDQEGIDTIVGQYPDAPSDGQMRFIHSDYNADLDIAAEGFDLLVSLYAGFVSESCTEYLRLGGTLLVSASHGDVAMASIDDRYRLIAVVKARSGAYQISTNHLENHLVPKKPVEITAKYLHERQRGIAYVTAPFAYLFERVR